MKNLINKSEINNMRQTILLILSCLAIYSCSSQKNNQEQANDFPLEEMTRIEKSIKEPQFKNLQYNITNFGAKPDGKTLATESFKKAIEECNKNGGGKVIVPYGKFLTGAIHLLDNVNLHLEDGAEIIFSTNPNDFPIVHTSFEGLELMNYSPL